MIKILKKQKQNQYQNQRIPISPPGAMLDCFSACAWSAAMVYCSGHSRVDAARSRTEARAYRGRGRCGQIGWAKMVSIPRGSYVQSLKLRSHAHAHATHRGGVTVGAAGREGRGGGGSSAARWQAGVTVGAVGSPGSLGWWWEGRAGQGRHLPEAAKRGYNRRTSAM